LRDLKRTEDSVALVVTIIAPRAALGKREAFRAFESGLKFAVNLCWPNILICSKAHRSGSIAFLGYSG
jgi:hypothetical protein